MFVLKIILFFILIFSANANGSTVLSINVALQEAKTPILIYNFKGNNDHSRSLRSDIIKKINFFSNVELYNPIENRTCKENAVNIRLTSYCIEASINKISSENYILTLNIEYSSSDRLKTFDIPFNSRNLGSVSDNIVNIIYKEIFNTDTFLNSKIAYVKTLRQDGKIWYSLNISNYDMTNERQIIVSPEPITSLSWNHNNTILAYTSFENIRPAIYTYDINKNEKTKIISIKGINNSPKWSPDGTKMAFSLSRQVASDIYVYDFRTKQIENITNRNNSIDTEPEWLDNRNIIFTSNRNGNPNLFRINIDNKNTTRINTGYNYVTTPVYSKNSNNIISIVNNNGRYGLLKTNIDTGKNDIIKVDFFAESPTISKEGDIIYYISKTNNRNHIKVINSTGKELFNINSRLDIKDVTISN